MQKKSAKSSPKVSKASPAMEPSFKPTLHLDGKHAEKMNKQTGVGKRVKMVVDATVASQSMSQSYMDPSKKDHSTRLEINSMRPHKPTPRKKYEGHVMSLTGKGNEKSVDAAINSPKKSGKPFNGVGKRSEASLDKAKDSVKGGKPFSGIGSRSEGTMAKAKSTNKGASSMKKGGQSLDGFNPSRHDKRFGGQNGKKGV
jgi:hypothetical protein